MPRDFPDQMYLDQVRAALWRRGRRGRAAVMVGAGMSLNALPRSAGGLPFPKWRELTEAIVDKLYPAHGGNTSEQRDHALEQTRATSGFLRIAQEYESAFGREDLEGLVNFLVSDRQFEPGDLHRQLLALPWSDIFTTNWDTLLEREAVRVLDQHYDVVQTIAEIPTSARPRIVKLHGTIPAIRPYILTEEDFRTYPTRFAPFVNLVQQAMMENVFCLLGFSGDDPNFLYWSGWVRDHLRSYTPHIYLVGWLDLTQPRRRMLEDRGVRPIDVARLPGASEWPHNTHQKRAVDWFLWSLQEAEPYAVTRWPQPPLKDRPHRPAYLPEAPSDKTQIPREESVAPEKSSDSGELLEMVSVWHHNRKLYPGWLIAPQASRFWLWHFTELWIPNALSCLPQVDLSQRIKVLAELNWRMETALVPLTKGLVAAISATLNEVEPSAFAAPHPDGSADDLQEQWVSLAVACLRAAREADDDKQFRFWSEALSFHQADISWLVSRIAYEQSLWALARLDHSAADQALLRIECTNDLFWTMRRAGILAELGKVEEAFSLARSGLSGIRGQLLIPA